MTTAATAASLAPDDPSARLAAVTRAAGLRTARELAPTAAVPVPRTAPSGEQDVLPVHAQLAHLLPAGGLRRGSVVTVRGSHALLWMLLAEATQAGSWAGLVGLPDLGLLAGLDFGVPAERLMLIPEPGPDLGTVLSALLDGVDIVALGPQRLMTARLDGGLRPGARRGPGGIDAALARRLANRARHRGGVILTTGPWPGADLKLSAEASAWSGLGHGAGYLTGQNFRLTVSGRGTATRARTSDVTLHSPTATFAEPRHALLSIVSTA